MLLSRRGRTSLSDRTHGLAWPRLSACKGIPSSKLLNELEYRLAEGRRKLTTLAEERAGTDKLREQAVETLYRWFIHGEPRGAEAAHV